MATFTNYATLSYSGGSTDSNTVTGEILETLVLTKTAVTPSYTPGEDVTYVVSMVNSGTAPLTNLTLTDNLGGYSFDTQTLYPLSYVDGSVRYYVNGTLQAAPTVTAGPPLTVTGISIPAGGNALVIYEARVTSYAPLGQDATITNTAVLAGQGADLTAQETISPAPRARLTISKAISPATVTENGQITYTFVIENSGSLAATDQDNVVLTDTFNPILNPITVTYNGVALTEPTDYTYNTATGLFATVPGVITVPAATYTQSTDGTYVTTPGTATLTVTGTL